MSEFSFCNETTAICLCCGTSVKYKIKCKMVNEEIIYGKLKGQQISYLKDFAYCVNCNNEVWVGELDDLNAELYRLAVKSKEETK